jgi:hypothetical protein
MQTDVLDELAPALPREDKGADTLSESLAYGMSHPDPRVRALAALVAAQRQALGLHNLELDDTDRAAVARLSQ